MNKKHKKIIGEIEQSVERFEQSLLDINIALKKFKRQIDNF